MTYGLSSQIHLRYQIIAKEMKVDGLFLLSYYSVLIVFWDIDQEIKSANMICQLSCLYGFRRDGCNIEKIGI